MKTKALPLKGVMSCKNTDSGMTDWPGSSSATKEQVILVDGHQAEGESEACPGKSGQQHLELH